MRTPKIHFHALTRIQMFGSGVWINGRDAKNGKIVLGLKSLILLSFRKKITEFLIKKTQSPLNWPSNDLEYLIKLIY